MAGAAFDMSGFEPEAAATPSPKAEAQVDLSGFQPETDTSPAPSFIKRAARAADLVASAMDPTGTGQGAGDAVANAGRKVLAGIDRVGEKAEKAYNDIGYVDINQGDPDNAARVKAFDVPKATNIAVALGTAPLASEYVGAKGLEGLVRLGAGTAVGTKLTELTREGLDHLYPSRAFHARLMKWLTSNGVGGAAMGALMAGPHVLKPMADGAKLHDPGLVPEEPAETPETAKEAPEGGLPPESPPPSAAEQATALSKLTPKPETEPVAPGMESPDLVPEETPLRSEEPTPEQAAQEQATSEVAKHLSAYPGGQVVRVPTGDINTDPPRFQYKLNTNKEGAGVSLTKAKFNPNLAETALLWRDPENNKLYAVNGHNRLSLAKESDFPYLEAKIADGGNSDPDAFIHNSSVEDVRSLGALQNIANEKGTAVDAAKFFRDQNATPEDLKKIGIDMGAKMTGDALALKKLDDNLFHFVTVGDLTPNQGVIIGEELGDSPAGQNAAFKWLKGREAAGKDIPNDVLREVARDIKEVPAEAVDTGQGGLFGEEEIKKSLFEERGEIMAGVKRKIASERLAFGNAARNKAKLEGVGNVITDENALIAEQADNRIKILNAKKTGPINDALNEAARKFAANPKNKKAIIDDAYKAITKAADETLPQEQAPEAPGLFGKPAKAPMEPGTTLGVSIPGGPQIAKALEPSFKWLAEDWAEGGKAWRDRWKATLMPQTLGPLAKRASQQLIEAQSEKAARIVPDEIAFAPLRAELEKIPRDQWRQRYAEFYDAYEKGQVPPNLPREMAPLMRRIKQATDERLNLANAARAKAKKGPIAYLDNWLPHLYADDPAKVRETLLGAGRSSGKPLTQGTPFLNPRKYLDIASAMKAGLTPRYTNPIDMLLKGLSQFDSYIMAQTMFNNMYDAGMLKFVKPGEFIEGYDKIPDRFFTAVQRSPEEGGIIERGAWQAPKEVVAVLSNHLSPSIADESKGAMQGLAGGALRHFRAGSTVAKFNAYRVGFSAFHFLNESNAAMASFQGAGLARAAAGMLAGDTMEMRNGLRIYGKANEPISTMVELFHHGDKMMRALVEPGTQGAEYDAAVKAAVQAGMRFKPEQMGTLAETMQRAAQEVIHPLVRDIEMTKRGGRFVSARDTPLPLRVAKGIARTPANLAQLSSAALMQKIVPTVKLGAFYKLAGQEMDHYVASTGGALPFAMQREILQNVAHHVDSVFGQMVEDNLMMDRTTKDILHMGIAYPGWNIGSLRLAWKAASGLGRATADMSFKNLDTQQRLAMQFALGLVTSQAVQNAMLQYVLAGAWPRSVQDLFQPQDGRKDNLGNPTRIAAPSYARTYYSLSHHPVSWAQNIENPVWGLYDDIHNNRERFTGRQIVDPQAPLGEQTKQVGEYLWRFVMPFSVSNAARMEGAGPGRKALGYAGYSPVPAQYLRTEAENHVYELAGEKAPRVGLNQQQYNAKQAQTALEDAIREKKPLDAAHKKMLDSVAPELKTKIEEDAAKAARLPRIVNMMRRMTLHDVIETYKIAEKNGDVRNQKLAKLIIENKAQNMDPNKWKAELEALDPGTRERYQNLLQEILTGKPGEKAAAAGPEA